MNEWIDESYLNELNCDSRLSDTTSTDDDEFISWRVAGPFVSLGHVEFGMLDSCTQWTASMSRANEKSKLTFALHSYAYFFPQLVGHEPPSKTQHASHTTRTEENYYHRSSDVIVTSDE